MREIKFRGKRVDNGEWVHGYIVKVASPCGLGWVMHIPAKDPDDNHRVVQVNPSTVGQYTGLKDKNGVEIYEGDVCACKKRGISADAFEIFWMREEGCWGWKESEESLDPFYQSIANYTEVISNIHDNPELLGGAE